MNSRIKRLLERFAGAVTARPGRAFVMVAVVVALSLVAASRLRLESSYLALLPKKAPEVAALEEVRRYSGGTSELVIAVSGPVDKRLPFARRIVRALRKSELVEWAEVELPTEFFRAASLYLVPPEKLRQLIDGIDREIARAKIKANPMLVDLEEDDDAKKKHDADKGTKVAGTLSELRARAATARKKLARSRVTSDGRYLLISVKPRASSSQLGEGEQVLAGLQRIVERSRGPGDRDLRVRFAGSLVVNQDQNKRMSQDLSLASLIALLLAIGLITLVSRRLSATLVVGVPLIFGVVVTLAVAALLIGHLNLVSGFLVAALVGLGVDFGIHLYLRYLEERVEGAGRAGADSPAAAMRRAIIGTFGPCLTAAVTTSAAFLALLAADFRGFSEYGLIAAVGVLLTLVITFIALPPLALFVARFERSPRDDGTARRLRNTRQLARPLAWGMVVAGFAFVLFGGSKVRELSFYNNFKKLQGTSAAVAFDDYVTKEVGGSLSPALLMVDSLEQARQAERILRAHIAEQGEDGALARVVSIASLLPAQLDQRRTLLEDLRSRLATVLVRGDELSAADRQTLSELHALTTVEPWGVASVPPAFRHRLIARHGGKHFVLLWPRKALEDDRRIGRWAGELRVVLGKLRRAGITAPILDENLIAARVVDLIRQDGPRVLCLAAGAVLLILLLDFRRFDRVLLVGSSVVLGITAMLGLMVLFEMHLNLFNAVVLPTVLGIGIDNAVHLMHAYEARGRGSVPLVVATSGRAALLSSATTAIGFGSSIVAHHLGIQQLGVLALIGVGTTFAASTILLPAVLRLLEGDDDKATGAALPTTLQPATTTGAQPAITTSSASALASASAALGRVATQQPARSSRF